MAQNEKQDFSDFSKSNYTAIISDLHLCEEEPIHSKYPLWKKYKTRQFFFDHDFDAFLKTIEIKAKGQPIELVLNGDIFDFDSVTTIPEKPSYRVSWLEKERGLHPQEDKSIFKIKKILHDHKEWIQSLRAFICKGHRAIFVVGNHDIELSFKGVQKEIKMTLDLPEEFKHHVQFNEWFYVSNGDTLIEHGHQYDPYCVCEDPINPFIQNYNKIEVRIPFGNLATRYLINGMGFFNPHVDSNFIMSAKEYVVFFFKYMLKAQPLLMLTWFWGATATLLQSFFDRLKAPIRNPLTIEDRINSIAKKANAEPRVVRELKELIVAPAASDPLLMLRELWLDRAFLVLLAFFGVFQFFIFINNVYDISFFWMFIPLFLFLPFFIFYSRSIDSDVLRYKEPQEKILNTTSMIAKVNRIVYGHTHIPRHEIIGSVEHLNSGTWSPAFLDVECEKPIGRKTFVWIQPGAKDEQRKAQLLQFTEGRDIPFRRKA